MTDPVPSYGRPMPPRQKPRIPERLTVAEISRGGRGETIRIALLETEGRAFVDIRRYRTIPDGRDFAGQGVMVDATKLAELRAALGKANQKLSELGFFDGEGDR